MGPETTPVNPLSLSDEEFSNLNAPPEVPASGEGNDDGDGSDTNANKDTQGGEQEEEEEEEGSGAEGDGDGAEGEDDPDKKKDDNPPGDKDGEGGNLHKDKSKEQNPTGKSAKTDTPDGKDPKNPKPTDKPGQGEGSQDGKDPPGSKADEQTGTPDYEGFYKKLMAPLKANGKTIEIKNPDEAIQLMQMGANYTRKMQALAPHRKYLLMLENNGLLDEGKLSYLIDLDKKNPEAIKKLIKDAQIDPREIDLEDPNAKPYLEGNHRVSDEETGFRTVLDELSSNPEGKATLQTIHSQWDQASKEVLWKEPEVMSLIHQQRESGVYDRIATELERQRTLGTLPPNVPFLHAYKAIGDQMSAAGKFDDLNKPADPAPRDKTPVTVRTQKPKSPAANGDKVNAASSTRASPRKAETLVNPLALSDEDFMKQVSQFEGRL